MDPFREVVEIAMTAEENGFDYFQVGDSIIARGLSVTLGAMTLETKRIRVGPVCAIPYLRQPRIIALATGTLDELSGGSRICMPIEKNCISTSIAETEITRSRGLS
jgi:5,10-methylenetetrahydromethanopterin reductase